MLKRTLSSVSLTILVASSSLSPDPCHAALAVGPYLGDDVAAVAYVDLTKIDIGAAIDQFANTPIPKQQIETFTAGAEALLQQLRTLGIGQLFCLLRTSDVAHGGPTWVVPLAPTANSELLVAFLEQSLPAQGASPLPLPKHSVVLDGYLLAATSPEQLTSLQQSRRPADAAPSEARQAVTQVVGHAAGLVVFGEADSRRVVRELFPQLPPPFENVDGGLIADHVRWASMTLDLSPQLLVAATIQTSDPTVAQHAEVAIVKALQLAAALTREAGEPQANVPEEVVEVVEGLRPQIDGARVSLTLGDDPQEVAAIAKLVAQPIGRARQSARRAQRMNQFRQIAVAMHNHAVSHKTFPAAAIYDDQGRPLLSWRVAILPYLEELELYQQFRLDEPWDSEHNRRLIPLMPAIYADPDPGPQHKLGDQGLTTYQVPVGEGTVFSGTVGMKLGQITDGTSKTVLAVEVVPDRAVVWTRPSDWQVDWNNPLDGVRREDGRPFTTIRCDGAAHIVSGDVDAAVWVTQLTATAGDIAE